MSLRNNLIRRGVASTLRISASLARREYLAGATRWLMHGMASAVVRTKGIGPASSVADLGSQWQRAFPSKKQVPITHVDATTAYGEIHTPCPLRGTGDVHACYRMMEFDRAVLRSAGGEFVVLQSQAAGHDFCKVAMRPTGLATDDLVPAHRAG